MKKFASIDIGSNTVRLLILECDKNQNFHIITKTEKSSINLGCFNAQVLENSLYIYKAKMKYFEEPMYIQKLRIIDVATYIYNPDRFTDEQNQKILKPFREKRVWSPRDVWGMGRVE